MAHQYMLAGTSQTPYGPGSGGGGPDYGLGSGSAGGGVLRDNTLGASPSFGIQEGNVRVDAPVVPFIGGAVGAFLLGSAWKGYGYVVGAVGGYFLMKLAQAGIQGQRASSAFQ